MKKYFILLLILLKIRKVKNNVVRSSTYQQMRNDVVVPATKSFIQDCMYEFISRLLYGEPRRRHTGPVRTSYSDLASQRRFQPAKVSPGYAVTDYSQRGGEHMVSPRVVMGNDDYKVYLQSGDDAEEVLNQLKDLVATHEKVTLVDLKDLLGLESNFIDTHFCWYGDGIKAAHHNPVREMSGYALTLPIPVLA